MLSECVSYSVGQHLKLKTNAKKNKDEMGQEQTQTRTYYKMLISRADRSGRAVKGVGLL